MDADGVGSCQAREVQVQRLGGGVVHQHGGGDDDGVRTDGHNLEPFGVIVCFAIVVEMSVLVSVELESRGKQPVIGCIHIVVEVVNTAVHGVENEGAEVPVAVLHAPAGDVAVVELVRVGDGVETVETGAADRNGSGLAAGDIHGHSAVVVTRTGRGVADVKQTAARRDIGERGEGRAVNGEREGGGGGGHHGAAKPEGGDFHISCGTLSDVYRAERYRRGVG